ncbi:hypothetical protein EXU48_14045 [Occultella glacieicola]|uniref:Uncharacterized protein n=1 Tax=Occultella glacieicola TaxID=2518684 RepID=A0ABY2E232_9MICO|nr:hypothetical protein [Occultella glacieicola]TDE92654.1 hypothetical protein EXU48_14045 [Occultella glacieicola]
MAAWASTARAAAAPHARQLIATTTESFVRRWAHVHDRLEVFLADGLPLRTPDADVALTLELSGPGADRKLVALRAHASQTAGMLAAIGEDALREWWSVETFLNADRPAAPAPQRGSGQRRGCNLGHLAARRLSRALPRWSEGPLQRVDLSAHVRTAHVTIDHLMSTSTPCRNPDD